jgi:uncharacterized protein (UPF0276 family)
MAKESVEDRERRGMVAEGAFAKRQPAIGIGYRRHIHEWTCTNLAQFDVRTVQSRISVPFLLENITYIFDWPDKELSDAGLLSLICAESGAGVLLDVENLYLNAANHGLDPFAFLDDLPANAVKEVHVAGGITLHEDFLERPLLQDTHSHPVHEAALDLLDYALTRQAPAAIVLERDDRLDAFDEILSDVARLRARFGCSSETRHARSAVGSAD